MAEKFTDKEGNEVTLITKENVEEYKNWLTATQDPDYLSVEVAPELKLSELIPANAYLNEKQRQIAASVVAHAMKASAAPEKCAEFISLASVSDTSRSIIGKAWKRMGNASSNIYHYREVADTIKNTPDTKLIGFNLACIENGDYTEIGKTDDGKNLTNREKTLLSLIAETRNGAYVIIDMVKNGSLINADITNREVRQTIDNAIINNGVSRVFKNLDIKLVTKEILLHQLRATHYFEKKNTDNAKTQAEKNANILPQSHTRLQEAFMYLTEKQNKYDSSDYGREKGLYERFTDLCKDMGLNSELANNPILQNIGLQIATRDVQEGNIAKLNREMLEKVIANDKSNEIASNLPDAFVEKNKGSLLKISPYLRLKDSAINNMDASWALPAVVESKDISLALKERILDEAEKANAARAPEKATLKQNINSYLTEIKQATTFYNQNHEKINDAKHAVDEINAAYKRITALIKTDKNGKPSEAEAYLSAENLGKILAGNNPQIPLPQQGSLPLFGRGAEKERREQLDKSIKAFNQMVQTHMPTLNQDVYDKNANSSFSSIKKILGDKILANTAPSLLNRSEIDCRADFNNTRDALEQKYGRYEAKQSALEVMERTDKLLADTRNNLNNLKTAMKEAAHELSGVKAAQEQSKLQVVDSKLVRAEKAAVRQANKAIVDPLAKKQDAKAVLKAAKQQMGR